MTEQTTDTHFKFIYAYVCATTFLVLCYVFIITYIPMPKENQRFADTALGFLLGTVLSGGVSWLVGGTAQVTKKATPSGGSSAEISATIVTDPDPVTQEAK